MKEVFVAETVNVALKSVEVDTNERCLDNRVTSHMYEGKRRKMLLPLWESNPTPPACRAGILTTRPRGRLSFIAYQRVIVPPQVPVTNQKVRFAVNVTTNILGKGTIHLIVQSRQRQKKLRLQNIVCA